MIYLNYYNRVASKIVLESSFSYTRNVIILWVCVLVQQILKSPEQSTLFLFSKEPTDVQITDNNCKKTPSKLKELTEIFLLSFREEERLFDALEKFLTVEATTLMVKVKGRAAWCPGHQTQKPVLAFSATYCEQSENIYFLC